MKLSHMLTGAMAFAILGSAAPARAQTFDPSYPVCLQVFQGYSDFYYECAYTSIPQCQASASGRYASCMVNPYYGGPKGKRNKRTKPPGY